MSREPRRVVHPAAILDAGLFHQDFYQRQRSDCFTSLQEAFDDYLQVGVAAALSPHPLFDVAFYVRRTPEASAPGVNPLLHYLAEGWRDGRDPHPLFDQQWYITQVEWSGETDPLSHYLTHARDGGASPNPLFDSRFYTSENPDVVRAGVNPFEHYVLYGRRESRAPAAALRTPLSLCRQTPVSLRRGTWLRGHPLWIVFRRREPGDTDELLDVIRETRRAGQFDVRVIVDGPEPMLNADGVACISISDLDVRDAGSPMCRASGLRMLLFALSDGRQPVSFWQNTDDPPVADAFADLGIPARAVFRPFPMSAPLRSTSTPQEPGGRRICVPCADWSLSGVHTVAQALGLELLARGWEFSLLFTRGAIGVLDRTTDGHGLPLVPYELLDTSACRSARDRWAAIIRHVERRAPCVVLAAFDDFANAVAPALSDRVGVVGWLQSDEDHYYESAYRLGRYWNAIVGVSRHIVEQTVRLNPAFQDRMHVIHNSTVPRDQILSGEAPPEGPDLRIVYVGRLVQYQKRILDVVPLVRQIERRGLQYRMTLVGALQDDDVERQLRRDLAEPLNAGRLRLTGPLDRAHVLQELRAHNVFLLLSDFEGLPVSLIEGMACGCIPAVARVQSGIPDVIAHDENGLIFDHRNYDVWAGALSDLVRDRARMAAMSDRARRTVRERFTVETMADRFEELFASVLAQTETGAWTRPPALTWQNPTGDVLAPPFMFGRALD